jgi:hypothetical protein
VTAVAHGPAVVLGILVAIAIGYPLAAATAGLALLATSIRWGSGWLVAFTGAQAVLGPAVFVGPAAAAVSSWLAAAALVVAVPDRSIIVATGSGAAAALLVAGPGGWGGVAVRVVATVALVAAAVLSGRLGRPRERALGAAALAAAAVVIAVVTG